MYQIQVENLGKEFDRRVIFRRLSFELDGGERLAVTGPNGSGKSTLVRMLAGVLRPSKGQIRLRIGEHVMDDGERPLRTGLVAPYLNVYDGLSARENLLFIARARRFGGAAARIHEMLDLVGLTARADDRVATFSSGMKQRVRFACALLMKPPLLLLDEPTSNLDPPGIAMVDRVIDAHREEGGLLILATNDAHEAGRCGRVLRIEAYHA